MLVLLISVFAIFVVKTLQMNVYIAEEIDDYKFRSRANVLFEDILRCVSDNSTTYPYLLGADRLDAESGRFAKKMPPCMRDESYGWNAVVRDLYKEGSKSWQFGEPDGSHGAALEKDFSLTMPVAIRYGNGDVNEGDLTLNLMSGDLEYLVGHIESVYRAGFESGKDMSASISMRFDNEFFMEKIGNMNRICMKGEDTYCETLSFGNIQFEPISPGMHYLVIRYDNKKKMLSVSE